MTDETLHALAYMFQCLLSVAEIQIVNVHIGGQAFTLSVWQIVTSALFFVVVVKIISAFLSEGKGGVDDD